MLHLKELQNKKEKKIREENNEFNKENPIMCYSKIPDVGQ